MPRQENDPQNAVGYMAPNDRAEYVLTTFADLQQWNPKLHEIHAKVMTQADADAKAGYPGNAEHAEPLDRITDQYESMVLTLIREVNPHTTALITAYERDVMLLNREPFRLTQSTIKKKAAGKIANLKKQKKTIQDKIDRHKLDWNNCKIEEGRLDERDSFQGNDSSMKMHKWRKYWVPVGAICLADAVMNIGTMFYMGNGLASIPIGLIIGGMIAGGGHIAGEALKHQKMLRFLVFLIPTLLLTILPPLLRLMGAYDINGEEIIWLVIQFAINLIMLCIVIKMSYDRVDTSPKYHEGYLNNMETVPELEAELRPLDDQIHSIERECDQALAQLDLSERESNLINQIEDTIAAHNQIVSTTNTLIDRLEVVCTNSQRDYKRFNSQHRSTPRPQQWNLPLPIVDYDRHHIDPLENNIIS